MKHIYVNGTILTMEDMQKQVEAICFEDERIVGLGNRSDLIKRFPEAEIHDLCGKTMLPAFLDAHSHFTGVANALRLCDLSDATSFDDIIIKMKEFAKDRKLGKQDWLIGANYDHNFMKEKDILTDMCLMKSVWSNQFTFLMHLHIWELPIALPCRHVDYIMQ